MYIDFHTHAKLSKKSEFDIEFFLEGTAHARECGLDAIVITEHFNTKNYDDVFYTMDKYLPYEHDYYLVNGLKAFTGMEVDVANGGHILLIANRDSIRAIRKQLEHHTEEDSFISLAELIPLANEYDCFIIGAHPFRESNSLFQHNHQLLTSLHAFDLNGKDLFTYGVESMKEKVFAFGNEIGLPVVTGSDTHHPIQFGCVKTKLFHDCYTAQQLRETVLNGEYNLEISKSLQTRVFSAKTTKKYLKELLNV